MISIRAVAVALLLGAIAPAWGGTAAAAEPIQQEGVVAGVVFQEASMRPLAGVQVVAEGTGRGTITDGSGRFRITGLSGGQVTLQASMVGYRPAEATVAVGATNVRLSLAERAIELDAVVVTGTPGAVQRRAIGNTVARIDAARTVELAPVSSVADLVNARTPGVVVRPGAGTAGAGARIKIRGTSSLTLDAQPLIYIDGVRVDNAVGTGPNIQGGNVSSRLNDINPDDIESMEIIKGPAAATLYGTEASAGVIQIITKKGRPNDLRVGVSIRQGATWFMDPEGRFPTNWWQGPETGGELRSLSVVQEETARGNPIFRTGWLQGYALNLSGGSERFQFYVGTDLDRDEGVEDPNVARRYSGRANLSVSAHPTLDVQTNLGVAVVRNQLTREESPTQSVIGATLRANPRRLNTPSRGFWTVPPEVIWDVFDLSQSVNRFTGSLQLNHRPAEWLAQRLTVGGDLVHENNVSLIPNLPPEQAGFFNPRFAAGSKDVNRRDVTNTTVDYSATVSVPLTSSLNSRTSAGAQYYRKFHQFFFAQGAEFPAPGVSTVAAAAVRLGADDYVENVTVGTFIQEEISLNDRLFLTGAVRADDNSAFGRDFDVQIYPKVSGSWVVSEEPFWNLGLVSTLRLRAAYGQSGQQPDAFAAIRTYEPVTGTGDRPAATPQSLGNPELGPERGEEVEVGFEASLLEDRVGIDFTYFNQHTRDAILLAPVAPSSGFPGSRFVNAGEVRNQGVELLLTGRPIMGPRLGVEMTLNLSTSDNEIVSLGGLPTIGFTGTSPGGPTAEHREGYPPYSFFLKRVTNAELNSAGTVVNAMCDDGEGGSIRCADAPRLYMGKLEPDLQGAFSSTVTLFQRFRLYALLDYQFGRTQFAEDNWVRCSIYRICLENFRPQEFPVTRIAEVQLGGSDLTRSIYYNDADFMKLREVSLSYSVPTAVAERFGAQRASISVAGRNLHTWTDYPGLDPETTKLGLIGGFNQSQVPMMAQFVTSVNLTF
jgi:TonB-dependent SusC/RagA subfamily outer membrane receptor